MTITYPLSIVSTISCVSGSSLAAANPPNMPVYTSWLGVFKHLSETVRYFISKKKIQAHFNLVGLV